LPNELKYKYFETMGLLSVSPKMQRYSLFKNIVDDDTDRTIDEGIVSSLTYTESDKAAFNADAALALYEYLRGTLAEFNPKAVTVGFFENDDTGLAMIQYSDSAVFKAWRHHTQSSEKVECGSLIVQFYAVRAR
jgi:hypothetical protein